MGLLGKGIFTLLVGCMYAGKTEELIRRIKRFSIAGYEPVVFAPSNSRNRYGLGLSSYSGLRHEDVYWVDNDVNGIKEMAEVLRERIARNGKRKVVGIDEIQFFSLETYDVSTPEGSVFKVPYVWDFIELVNDLGINVIGAGLDKSFRGYPFSVGMMFLMSMADELVKLHAVCDVCKKDNATHTLRMHNVPGEGLKYASWDEPLVMVGSKDSYMAVCKDDFKVVGEPKSSFKESLKKVLSF